ncbi:uncharacterized protein LOC131926926 isoform X3 [Physella acuta]|uniref:uncharacterized protein LOC131926926 isoform X3 n=1 Tax=Physella acuta TaxID=109671 RepID=UPI0027DBEA19|nr:uncharacterized protein LOC131926926 isoform X3 [Physella acuta]
MNTETNRAVLKQTIIRFLKTCNGNKCHKDEFWNEVAKFQKKSVSHRQYGVSKMHALLDIFNDILTVKGDYVVIKQIDAQTQALHNRVVISDSDEEEEEAKPKASSSREAANTKAKGKQVSSPHSNLSFRDKLLAVLRAQNGQCEVWRFIVNYEAAYGSLKENLEKMLKLHSDVVCVKKDVIYLLPQKEPVSTAPPKKTLETSLTFTPTAKSSWGSGVQQGFVINLDSDEDDDDEMDSDNDSHSSHKSSMSNSSGFIPFTGSTSMNPAMSSGQFSHQRYGLLPQPPSGPMASNPQGQMSNLQAMFRMPMPPSLAPPYMPRFIGQQPQMAVASPALMAPQVRPPLPLMYAPALPTMSNQTLKYARSQSSDQSEDEVHMPVVQQQPRGSEWPKPPVKSGPPPGTKITEEAREIIIRPIMMQRGTRLSMDQVNQQILECIDLLSGNMEHVSIERLELMITQKYQVRNFRDLNLPEKMFTSMPAAKEHSLLLGKVNVYVQNFVRSRSLCTLFELKECCREFHPKRKDFDHLKLGPLQKMPVVYETFKFPYDEYIPEITSIDLMEQLNNFLDKTDKWKQHTNIEEFVTYLLSVYNVTSAYSLGIRLRSLPLAIQMLKKSKRDAATTRRTVVESLKDLLNKDIEEAFKKFRANILQSGASGLELRQHYMNLPPEVALREIFMKFELLAQIFVSNPTFFRKIEKLLKHFNHFVTSVLEVPIPRNLFHLAVCMSNLEVQESATEFLEEEAKLQQKKQEMALQMHTQQADKKVPPTKVGLADKVLLYLNKCLEQSALKLSHLQRIETKILEDLDFKTFHDLGYGTFLDFIHSEGKIKKVLEECGGTALGSASGGHESESLFKPGQVELLEFVCQAKSAGLVQVQQVDNCLCEQYHVSDIRHLGHGNISRLVSAAEKSGKHSSKEYSVLFEAALCGKSCPTTRSRGQVGIHGSLTKEVAMACLTACPLLEDLAEWSHWSLVFQPQHGRLRDFIEKHGGQKIFTLEGGRKTVISDFMALEVEPGKLLKISSRSNSDQFCRALDAGDPNASAGHLVSMIVANKGLESTPLALLSNHLKTKLISLHAHHPVMGTPGGPPSLESLDLAVQFVTEILLRLPVRICVAVANQVLLEPLSQVVGSAKSKNLIIQACRTPWQRLRLELLGSLLGLPEWTVSHHARFEFPAENVEENLPDELLGQPEEVVEEEVEEDEDEESDSDESELDDILSQEVEETVGGGNQGREGESVDKTDDGVEEINQIDDDEEEEDDDDDKDENKEEGEDKEEIKAQEQPDIAKEANKSVDVEGQADLINDEGQADPADVGQADQVSADVEIVEQRELTHEEKCKLVVEDIRREEFGVGIKLDETGQKLMLKQQERQGRSLQRLSKDLYSKETHFVLELIQNADDNNYQGEVTPSVKFVIDASGVTVLNNETGFEEQNIRAICDVGKSTKSKHKYGYIGQKGIGFKSVFRVTSRPEVHSNGFHIFFDVNSGPMGYILPHWSDEPGDNTGWQTRILLPWTEEIKQHIQTHAARFNDIQPSLLLFLHRLKEIHIENKVEGSDMFMRRKDFPDGEIQISHSHGRDKWLVLRKILDASAISLQAKSGVEVESTEIALAFPLKDKSVFLHSQVKLEKLPVFAFLPLRSYGFRFIVQGDFDVPSSREDVDRDSSWNQWLRNEIHHLFIDALDAFKARPDLTPLEALKSFLQFIPLEGEVMGFFKPVASHILAQLRAKECMPVLTKDKKSIQWKMPSKTVMTRDSLVMEVVSPELLQRHLDLHYLHPEVTEALDEPLTKALGIESITTEHLLHIGRSIGQGWDSAENSDHVTEIAKWLACVYRSLDDFQDNTQTVEALDKMRIIPLSCGRLVALADVTVFLLADEKSAAEKKKKGGNAIDPFLPLKKDLNLVHTDLTNTPDNEVNSQVVKLLIKMGVKQMTPHDLIHSHIMPVLKTDAWKEKPRNVLISFLAYVKAEMEKNPSVVDMAELRSVARLVTNHGIKSPSEDDVHFSTAFGNKIDLCKILPGFDWTLVDSAYLPSFSTQQDKQNWHNFLSDLGVVDTFKVRRVELNFDKSTIHETPWSTYKDVWPDSPDGYTIVDFQCEEFHRLVTANQKPDSLYHQMIAVFELLDAEWSSNYRRYEHTQLKSRAGHVLKDDIQTSFAVYLKTLCWVPTFAMKVKASDDSKSVDVQETRLLQLPADLYARDPHIQQLLAHTVPYLDVDPQKNSSFTTFLQIKTQINLETAKNALISWGEREVDHPDVPKVFCSTLTHIKNLYLYLNEELRGKDTQDLFHNHPIIFVPNTERGTSTDIYPGLMMRREEVWWSDSTGLFLKYSNTLHMYKSPLNKFKIIRHIYSDLEEMFTSKIRVEAEPTSVQFAQLLKQIATVHTLTEDGVLEDILLLFSKIGKDLSSRTEIVAGQKTNDALKAEVNLPKVLDLLKKAAIFPTKLDQWVSLSDRPMIADSTELEEMFFNKPGVHFLQLKTKQAGKFHNDNSGMKESLNHFIHLFEEIKPLSECVDLQEITPGFQQCNKGQLYLHNIIGLLQRFLYFTFPKVYQLVKERKGNTLKEFLFSQVEHLEVRYELTGRTDVFEIREEKCIVKDKCFYFHEKYVSSQVEINKEIAKYFSEGNEKCFRELRSFLSQAVPILEGTSEESIESLLARQTKTIGPLPPGETIWEIPLPIIPVAPEPEPVPEMMYYGRALSIPDPEAIANNGSEETSQLKSWPPRSSIDQVPKPRRATDQNKAPSGIWPPPKAPQGAASVSKLPSNIKFERSEGEGDQDPSARAASQQVPHTGEGRGAEGQTVHRHMPHTGEGRDSEGHALQRQVSDRGENSNPTPRQSEGQGHPHGDGSVRVYRHGDGPPHPHPGNKDPAPLDGPAQVLSRRDSAEEGEGVLTGKRKLTEGSRSEETIAMKRPNSMEESPDMITETEQANSGPVADTQRHIVAWGEPLPRSAASSREITPSSLSRETTPLSFSANQEMRKARNKDMIHFSIPRWNETNEDLAYTELARADTLTLPPKVLEPEALDKDIGLWGEMLVLDYLVRHKESNSDIEAVLWTNVDGEKGLPYDFEIVFKSGEPDTFHSVFVEVKATLSWDKEVFHVSSKQIEFALAMKDKYEIFRVYGAGNTNSKLVRVENVAERMRVKQVNLFMVL